MSVKNLFLVTLPQYDKKVVYKFQPGSGLFSKIWPGKSKNDVRKRWKADVKS